MRRYDDPVDVRRGRGERDRDGTVEGPEQFLWRGRLWKVREVVAHWVETGPWWQSRGVHAVLGGERRRGAAGRAASRPARRAGGLAGRGRPRDGLRRATGAGRGVFDLVFDWAEGSWRLTRCLD